MNVITINNNTHFYVERIQWVLLVLQRKCKHYSVVNKFIYSRDECRETANHKLINLLPTWNSSKLHKNFIRYVNSCIHLMNTEERFSHSNFQSTGQS